MMRNRGDAMPKRKQISDEDREAAEADLLREVALWREAICGRIARLKDQVVEVRERAKRPESILNQLIDSGQLAKLAVALDCADSYAASLFITCDDIEVPDLVGHEDAMRERHQAATLRADNKTKEVKS
jgi:hypothetical protein